MIKHHKNHGIALITVLIILAIISPLVTKITAEQQSSMGRTMALGHSSRSVYYAMVVENWVHIILAQDKKESAHDGFDEIWSKKLPQLDADGGILSGSMIDLQGRFNLNNLTQKNTDAITTFMRLLQILEINEMQAEELKQAIMDWIDPDSETRASGGAEDDYYVSLEQPYRSASQPLITASELRQIKGVTFDLWHKLEPLVCALPPGTKININTAPLIVLQALFPEKDEILMEQFEVQRKNFAFHTIEDLSMLYENSTNEPLPPSVIKQISLSSSYFLAQIRVKFGDEEIKMQSMLHRSDNEIKTYARSLGGVI